MPDLLKKFSLSRLITLVLIGMMYVVVILSTIELGYRLFSSILSAPNFLPNIENLLDILGWFLLVLVAIELLDTIKAYLNDHVIHAEVVMEVAMIALARKIIVLDMGKYDPLALVGMAALLLALAGGYWMVKGIHRNLKKE